MMNYPIKSGLSLSLRNSLALLLGLAAVIAGIIGMHILNVSHHAPEMGAPDHATAVVAAPSHDIVVSAPGTVVLEVMADEPLLAAGCASPCESGPSLMAAVCVLMTIVAGFVLLFIPRQLRLESRHGLRAPPQPVMLAPSGLHPPSLVQLSISRT
ncbi:MULTISPECIES: DUF6153 family protein [Micrococcaceae]|uniref:Uncharacterized protein n=3 Tax=Micrococcaceae TaxID=1268 RepID=Q6SK50_PAEAU|nr:MULTISPECIES: DUF6153 family protein [Micrococcaceae]AAS20122.1 hypothetical protein [Paenarthrobacter aurescens]SDQ03404.1 hypothetical protein SAMN04489742_0081 [Arthrobacter crystallopoietes]